MLDHEPCVCGHMGWRHHPNLTCARCDCTRYTRHPMPPLHPPVALHPRVDHRRVR